MQHVLCIVSELVQYYIMKHNCSPGLARCMVQAMHTTHGPETIIYSLTNAVDRPLSYTYKDCCT